MPHLPPHTPTQSQFCLQDASCQPPSSEPHAQSHSVPLILSRLPLGPHCLHPSCTLIGAALESLGLTGLLPPRRDEPQRSQHPPALLPRLCLCPFRTSQCRALTPSSRKPSGLHPPQRLLDFSSKPLERIVFPPRVALQLLLAGARPEPGAGWLSPLWDEHEWGRCG